MKPSPSITRDSAALMVHDPDQNSGIYAIINTRNLKCYVGSSVNIRERMRHHFSYMLGVGHHSEILQRAFNKYGLDSFQWCVLEYVDSTEAELLAREQYWIDQLGDYNVCKFAGSPRGIAMTLSDSERARRSEHCRRMLSTLTPEQRTYSLEKAVLAKTGIPITAVQKEKLSRSTKGRPLAPAHREKVSARNKERVVSAEEYVRRGEKISHSLLLRTEDQKKEWKAKLSAAKVGVPSPKKGLPMSAESRQKMKEAWARRKAQKQTPA